jgi:hypothetical protein
MLVMVIYPATATAPMEIGRCEWLGSGSLASCLIALTKCRRSVEDRAGDLHPGRWLHEAPQSVGVDGSRE